MFNVLFHNEQSNLLSS